MQLFIKYFFKKKKPKTNAARDIETVSTWATPSVLDRVDGRYRGVVHRDEAGLNNKAGETLVQLSGNKEMIVRIAAVKAISKLKISAGSAKLAGLLKNDPQPSV